MFLPIGPSGLRGGVGPGDGDAAGDARGGRGLGLGRGVRRGAYRRPGVVRPRGAAHRASPRPGLRCAVGIGETKLQAKTATGFAKPGGVGTLTRRTWIETLGDRPVTAVWGIGARTASHLAELGIHTVTELARADHEVLARRFGPRIGPSLKVLGLGGDDAPVVDEPYVPKSRSKEVTFEHDVIERGRDRRPRRPPGDRGHRVGGRRGAPGDARGGEGADGDVLHQQPRSASCPQPTTDPAVVADMALGVLDLFDVVQRERPVRLLGVRVMLEPLG